MLLRSLHIASRQLFYLLVVSIILGLLGLMGAVWISEEITDRKDEIASWASKKTGYPITVGSAGLYWFDLIPKLEVRQIALLSETSKQPVAMANAVYVSLDILASIQKNEPVVSDVTIDGVTLSVQRNMQGQYELVGLDAGKRHSTAAKMPELIHRFTWLKQFELTDINLDFRDQQQASLSGIYSLEQAEVSFSENSWQIAAQAQLPEHLGSAVEMSGLVEIYSDYRLKSWQVKMASDQIDISPLFERADMNGAVIESGTAAFVMDASQTETKDLQLDINVDLSDVLLNSNQTLAGFEKLSVERIAGPLHWRSDKNTWQLKADALQVQIAGEPWPLTTFLVEKTADQRIQAEANYLRLSPLVALATFVPDMPEQLLTSKPAGEVEDFQFSYDLTDGLTAIKLKAKDIAMLPWQNYPGFNGLKFDLDWSPQQGQLVIDSHNTELYADTWLDDAVFLDSFSGDISWQNQGENWHVLAKGLTVWNEDFNLKLDGRINRQDQQLDSDLELLLQDVVVNRWLTYVPERILPEDFKKWSKDAFREGLIRTGTIKMNGDPRAFPFDKQPKQGAFDMQLAVENVQLHYAPGWPDISAVNGTVSGQGNNLLIRSQSGNIAGFAFADVTTTISNLVRPKPVLKVDGMLNGSTSLALSFLQQSPLEPRFGKIAEWIEAQGKSDIYLKLAVPLVDTESTEVSGYVSFVDSQLTTKAVPGLDISKVNGQLNFNNDGVHAEQLTAVVFNEPVSATVQPANGQTLIKLTGKANTAELIKIWPDVIPDFIAGQADYQTQIIVREIEQGLFDLGVEVNSDLRGVAIDAPAPLAKTTQQPKTFRLNIEQNEAEQLLYKMSLDSWLSAALAFDDTVTGQVMLGGDDATYSPKGLSIHGHLADLDLDPWITWQSIRADKDSPTVTGLSEVKLAVDQLRVKQQQLNDLRVVAKPADNGWQLSLNAEQVKGDVFIPQDDRNSEPLDIRLDHLHLVLPDAETETTVVDSSTELWPAMSVAIDELKLDGMPLGQLNLQAKRHTNSWQLESAAIKTPVMTTSISGEWTKTATEDKSQFQFEGLSDDLKALLAYYNYQQAVEAQAMKLGANLSWQGDPTSFSRQSLLGNMHLSVGRGRLVDVEPGAAGRIFGLLSVAAIPRRLALDFNDLFSKGFDFSSIDGSFKFADGIARTENLTMQGESALIEVSGPIDIVNKSYDQIVKVTPKVSSTLPIAGAVAGGPIGLGVGTAILIADKLVGTLFDQNIVDIISYSYQLTGPWDDPKLSTVKPATN
jgi:uncharacterized protein (TIGR02099 family)